MKTRLKFRSGFRAAITAFLLCLAAGAWLSPPALAGETDGTPPAPVVSAAEIDYPPFSVVDSNGRADGFSVELMKAALKAMGRGVEFRTGPWDEVKGWLEKGEVEALPLVGRTPEREKFFDFTFSYMSLYGAIVVRRDTKDITDLGHLAGRRVAVMKGDNAEEFLRRKDRGIREIITTTTFEEAFRLLSKGLCDAVVVQRLVAVRLLQQSGLANLKIISKPIEEFRQDWCFAVKKGDSKNLALLNEGLSLVMADGTFRSLHSKWFAALELPANRKIIVGGDYNYPPFEYLDESGRPAGYNVELIRAVAREVGLDIEFKLGPWAEVREALEKGEIDMLQGMFYSPERDLVYDFSPPHTVNHNVSVLRKGEGKPPATLAELSGKRIAVQDGDIMHDFALKNGLAKNVTAFASQADALRAVSQSRADCALVARVTALHLIKKDGLKNLVAGTRPLLSQDYCFAVKGGQKALLSHFSEGLKIIEENGEYRRIYQKWMGVYDDSSERLAKTKKWALITVVPLVLVFLGVLSWSWILRRQVARRTAEARRSEKLLAAIMDSIAAPVFYKDAKGVYLGCNRAFSDLFGFTREEIVGRTSFDVAPPDLAKVYHETDLAVMNSGKTMVYEGEAQNREDVRRQFIFHKAPFRGPEGNIEGVVGAMTDVTERKLAEESLKQSEDKFRSLFENMAAGCCLHEMIYEDGAAADYRILDVNPAYEHILGIPRQRAAGALASDLYGLGHAPYLDIYARVAQTGTPATFEIYFPPMGKHLHVTASSPVKGRFSTIFSDITDRKQAELRIEHLNRVLLAIRGVNQLIVREKNPEDLISGGCRLLVDNRGYISALIVLTDQNGKPAFWAESGLGESHGPIAAMMERGELPGCFKISELEEAVFIVDDRERSCKGCPIAEQCSESRSLCVRLAHDGRIFGYLAAALDPGMAVDEDERSLFTEMAGDIAYALHALALDRERLSSELKRKSLEDQLIQSQKMESVGRLAGGVAHDFNNQLSVILGHTELAMGQVEPSQPLFDDLTEIRQAAKRSADLTRQLLAFARKQTIAPRILDLNETVEGMLKMLRRLIGEDVELSWNPGADLWPVLMDPVQLDQIMTNLCVNARDAIKGVGKISIETQKASIDEEYCAERVGAIPGDFVLISVSDNGFGMTGETLARIFEPFFTTKGLGKGTGLGLSMVYGIVSQNGGFLEVESKPGRGSAFRIYLPRRRETPLRVSEPAKAEAGQGLGETLLLVEDEPSILNMAKRILSRQGYSLLAAASPKEALEIARTHSGEIRLLITDVVMPEMNGKDLADEIKAHHPEIGVLFMSGYTADVIAVRGVLDDGVNFIQKPFSMQELLKKVRAALDKTDSGSTLFTS